MLSDCAVCEKDYAPGFQYSCRSCKGLDKWSAMGTAVALIIVVLIGVIFVLVDLVRVVDSSTIERGKLERRALLFRDRLVKALPLTAIKIIVVTWQIITQVRIRLQVISSRGMSNKTPSPTHSHHQHVLSKGFELRIALIICTTYLKFSSHPGHTRAASV